jgi:hypothetical protein
LNGLVCGALFRPLPGEKKTSPKKVADKKKGLQESRLLRKISNTGSLGAETAPSGRPLSNTKSAPLIHDEYTNNSSESHYQVGGGVVKAGAC